MEGRGFVSCFAWAFTTVTRPTVFIHGLFRPLKGCGVSAFVLWRRPLDHRRQPVVQCTFPDGQQTEIYDFNTKAEAREWIATKSAGWLEGYKGGRYL
jgi:hypothetical protein